MLNRAYTEVGAPRLPFGKHRGTQLADVPTDYLQWLSKQIPLREPLKSSVEDELSRRNSVESPHPRIIASDAPAPFPSRRDTVVRLDFPYDPTIIATLKGSLHAHRAMAMDPARHIQNAGGFRPDSKQWWVEVSAWSLLRADLELNGIMIST